MKRKQLICGDEAVPVAGELKKPCTDCPWARTSLRGWLGSMSADEWIAAAHGETKIDCHMFDGPQCAGAAIYRANVVKSCRDRSIVRLEPNRVKVFASPPEFLNHHKDQP